VTGATGATGSAGAGSIDLFTGGAVISSGNFFGNATSDALEINAQQSTASAGHITGMYCHVTLAPPAPGTTLQLRDNGANVAGAIVTTSTASSVTGLSVAYRAGDLLDVAVSGTLIAMETASCSVSVGP
jgi:hypothetical protein